MRCSFLTFFLSIWNPDAVKRRTLPAWIREGLEKMDREKQKKLEKERMEKERAEMVHEEKDNEAEEEGDGVRLPRKSKFVSVRSLGPHPLQQTSYMLIKSRCRRWACPKPHPSWHSPSGDILTSG